MVGKMQTFFPYREFSNTAKILDVKRLGKQRVEVLQILKAMNGETKAWRNHPIVKMWSNNRNAIVMYGADICSEWIYRGYKDTCLEKILSYLDDTSTFEMPEWVNDIEVLQSHQSNLVRKNKDYYSKYFSNMDDELPYKWVI